MDFNSKTYTDKVNGLVEFEVLTPSSQSYSEKSDWASSASAGF